MKSTSRLAPSRKVQIQAKKVFRYSPAEVDGIWGIWGSYVNIPKPIFYILKGDDRVYGMPCIGAMICLVWLKSDGGSGYSVLQRLESGLIFGRLDVHEVSWLMV